MKGLKHFLIAGMAGMVSTACAQLLTNSFGLSPYAVVPDGRPTGWSGQFSANGLSGTVWGVQVALDISGGYNGDLYAYLLGPQGSKSILLNRPGVTGNNPFGDGDPGFIVTLDSQALNNIHDYGLHYDVNANGQVLGTWAADGRNLDPQSPGATFDSTPITAGLNIFQGVNATTLNGIWTIFMADVADGGGVSQLNRIEVKVLVPEPASWLLLISGGIGLLWLKLRR